MVFRPQACASATNTLACWARNLMRSTSNLFSSCASCSTEWPPAICETPSAIVFLSSGVTSGVPSALIRAANGSIRWSRTRARRRHREKKAARTSLTCPSLCCFCRSQRSSTPRFGFLLLDLPRSLLFSVPGYFVNATRLSASHQPIALSLSLAEKTRVIFPTWFRGRESLSTPSRNRRGFDGPCKREPESKRLSLEGPGSSQLERYWEGT